ncbi:hypothetical protein ACFOED_01620 [Vulcaniibacterium thermophilum]|uniref:hypothetical protein n=1 Tax=Vulcaniibacterium thermophilum TaxID=1169913 RepID=UPI0011B3B4EE|nr:hypothetical protein [Vulcaniibacterium thermophilum]
MARDITARAVVILELLLFAGTLAVAAIWYADPTGNWEPLLAMMACFTGGAELYRRFAPKSRNERFHSNSERLRHRERLRQLLQEEIYNCRAKSLRQDVIIRDVDRADKYPDTDPNEKGISAWFRVGLIDTYDKGVLLGLRYGGLKECEGGYRFVDFVNEEKSDRTVLLVANVPYDSIAEVNLDGDEYYHFPHIYCHFDFEGQPYERLWFAEKKQLNEHHPYFEKVAEYDEVTRNNPIDGNLYFC